MRCFSGVSDFCNCNEYDFDIKSYAYVHIFTEINTVIAIVCSTFDLFILEDFIKVVSRPMSYR